VFFYYSFQHFPLGNPNTLKSSMIYAVRGLWSILRQVFIAQGCLDETSGSTRGDQRKQSESVQRLQPQPYQPCHQSIMTIHCYFDRLDSSCRTRCNSLRGTKNRYRLFDFISSCMPSGTAYVIFPSRAESQLYPTRCLNQFPVCEGLILWSYAYR